MNRPTTAAFSVALLIVLAGTAAVYFHSLDEIPVYMGGDEAHSAIEAYSIATTYRDHTGAFLPLFVNVENPLPERNDGDRWWQPYYIYLQAVTLTFLPIAEWSVRLPSILLALANVALIYAIAARLFDRTFYAVVSALMLATTPVHLIFGRMALDYFAPVTFTLAWIYCLVIFLDGGALAAMAFAGLVLGVGMYSHISAWVFMPLFLGLTWLAVVWSRRRPVAAILVVTCGFALPLIPFAMWTRTHPEMLGTLLGSYQTIPSGDLTLPERAGSLLSYTGLMNKVGLYWSFFNPSFLFLAGGSNLSLSTRMVGVFLLPMGVFLIAGVRDLLTLPRTRLLGTVLTLGVLAAPVPAVMRGESQAIQRELVIVPFAVLIALYGLAALLRRGTWQRRAAVSGLLVAMAVQFAFFARDYFGEYQKRAAYWLDPVAFREVATGLLAMDAQTPLPAVYLSRDLDDGPTRWLFYLRKHQRADLWPRTHDFDPAHIQPAEIPPGSPLVLYANDANVGALVATGKFVLQQTVVHVGGFPSAVILRRTD